MGHLDELLARIDSMKRTVGRNVSDMATDPSLYAEKIVGALRNRNAGVAPVIAGGELANRPLTMDERVSDAIDNLAGVGITKAFKARPLTVFELRHATAQRNAALPVEQGGLGLPPNNTAMDRARAMGAVDVYHGTNDDIGSISMDFSGAKTGNPNAALGFFTTPNPSEASRYATGWGKEGANVMPLMAMPKSTYQMPFKELDDLAMLPYRKMMADPAYDPNRVVKFGDMTAQKEAAERMDRWNAEARSDVLRKRDEIVGGGFDSAVVNKGKPTEEFIALDPSIIRSRFAAFDPMRRHEADIMGFADPYLLAGIGSGGLLASLAVNKLRNRNE